MNEIEDRGVVVNALRHAIPYVRMYKGKTFVIKTGGAVLVDPAKTRALLEQVAILHQVGIRTVLVHGGGVQSTQLAESLGIQTEFVEGRRVTDEQTLDVATMVLNGSINTQLLAEFRDLGVAAVGLSGVDAGLVRATRRPPVEVGDGTVDYGFVGDIESINVDVLERMIESGLMPVISPISADESGVVLNINADTVAAAIAAKLKAEKLILMTGAPGILEDPDDPSSLVSLVDVAGLERMREAGSIVKGMLPKVAAVSEAARGGVRRVHIISYASPDSLLLEVFTNEGAGTLVVQDTGTLSQAEQAAAEGD